MIPEIITTPRFDLGAMRPWVLVGFASFCLLVSGCVNSANQHRSNKKSALDTNVVLDSGTSSAANIRRISRSSLRMVLGRSVGDLLRRYVRVEAVIRKRRFVGWRIEKIARLPVWMSIRPGDVIRKVNGLPLTRPADAQKAWEAVLIADEIHIDFLRNRKPHSLRIAVGGLSRL